MANTFEVAAVMKVVDEATRPLRRILESIEAVRRALNEVRIASRDLFPGLTRATEQSGIMAREWQSIARSTGTAAANIARATAAAAGGAAGVTGRGRGALGARRSAGGGLGAHVAPPSVPIPGGHASLRGGNAGLLGLGAIGYGIYEEAEVEDLIARALMTGQVPIGPDMTKMGMFSKLRGIIQGAAVQGGINPKEVAEAVLSTERMFSGLGAGEEGLTKRLDVIKTLIPLAMTEAKMKETTLKDAFSHMVGFMHMSGTYDPAGMTERARAIAYASTMTDRPLGELKTATGYAMTQLHDIMGMDPDTVTFLAAMAQTAGITSTKSGTWLRSFFQRLEPGWGQSERGKEAHDELLRESGLLGADKLPTWKIKDAQGATQWMPSVLNLTEKISKLIAGLPEDQRLAKLHDLFGERGAGFAGIFNLPEFIKQLPVLTERLKTFIGGENFLSELERNSPLQKAKTTWAELTNLLMDLAITVMPFVKKALTGIKGIFGDARGGGGERSLWEDMLGGGALGAGAGLLLPVPGGMLGGAAAGTALGATEHYFPLLTTLNRLIGSIDSLGDFLKRVIVGPTGPAGGTTPKLEKQGYLQGPGGSSGSVIDVYLDGEKITNKVLARINDRATWPLEGGSDQDNMVLYSALDTKYLHT